MHFSYSHLVTHQSLSHVNSLVSIALLLVVIGEFIPKELMMLEVYLTDLQAYNEGALVGRWVKLPIHENELAQTILEVLREGEEACGSQNHEEYFLSDHSWSDHEFMDIGEYSDIYALNESLNDLEFKSDYELKAISFLLSEGITSSIAEAIDKADDVIVHQNQSMEDVAYDLMNECYGIDKLPSIISNNLDYEKIGRELEMDGRYYEVGNDIYEYVG